ncbi:hypothetical protein JI735_17665 [Paenibacillus sonchi]|uniref:Uncharacterized protein n=1 Tax=Paenibacillus sonchi TaxID=373687 RepID=A0A974SAZ8_9BACL|nr:hypothetical protein [Paenibacillus sonchi]QQZ58616.1 hypothetical protein JI735_17665 [Paenibacillus sonchi]
MRVAGSVPRAWPHSVSGRQGARRIRRRYSPRYIAERQAVLVLILFIVLVIVLLYFT